SSNPIPALQARIGIAQGRGDDAEVGRLISQLQERMPQAVGPVMLEVDRLFARREEQQARRRMDRALAEEPEAMIELRRALRAMGGSSPLERYRLDGAQVIREFESSGRTYREPMVLVLDYTVHRVFADGSMLELTHNVFRLQSQEAVDAMGEFEVPEGAQLLTLQTVKADGRRLEPDEIAGKETISFASLAVGDYIEFEYLRPRGSAAGYPGGFVGERFYFQSFETPFDRSELTVVVPREIELTIDPRGPAPRTETREDDGTRVYQWRVRESRPLVQEPGSVASVEFLPSIYWGHGASWEQYVESLRDVLADRDVRDPAVERLVREIAGEGASPEARARRIYAWALREIDDSQDLFGQAAAMVAARSGNRTRALRYLLAIAGVPAELALVRSFTADSTRSELPDDDLYQNLLIRIRGDGGDPIWLSAGAQDAPFGYIPPPLAGMDALVLNEQAERATVTERSLEADLRRVEVEVALRGDGGARVTVVESYRGAGAVLWRNQLEEVPEAELERQFESGYVANLLPGSTLERLVISGREDPEGELVLRYEVE
ncbi:MAG: DUF3857 domain-containing protein, partial [Sandaracinaceae bacterium]|nr:DUF3857 domain-containing protein [Sandaracinaceae bacterium]